MKCSFMAVVYKGLGWEPAACLDGSLMDWKDREI